MVSAVFVLFCLLYLLPESFGDVVSIVGSSAVLSIVSLCLVRLCLSREVLYQKIRNNELPETYAILFSLSGLLLSWSFCLLMSAYIARISWFDCLFLHFTVSLFVFQYVYKCICSCEFLYLCECISSVLLGAAEFPVRIIAAIKVNLWSIFQPRRPFP